MTEELTEATERLADMLDRENAALAGLDLARAADLVADKERAAARFAAACAQANAAGSAPTPGAAPLARRLAASAAENRRLLERAISVQARVIALVARAVPRQTISSARYGAQGHAAATPHPGALALSLRA